MMLLALTSIVLLASGSLASGVVADPPHHCDPCEEWNRPLEPIRVHGGTWHVGTAGLGAVLVTSPEGHILIDGGLPQSAPLIDANIRKAGFRLEDVKLILNSHTHYDHAGGIAALQRASGAEVVASPVAKRALEHGGPREDDPQFAFGPAHNDFPRVERVREASDREVLRVGPLAVTMHFTPGHTPGGTSFSWRSCEGEACVDIVYADSLNAVSAPGFRFDDPALVKALEASIARIESLPCDIVLAAHPYAVDLEKRTGNLRDPDGCRRYAAGARERLGARLAEERAATR